MYKKEKKRKGGELTQLGGEEDRLTFSLFLVGAWGFVEGAAFTHLTFLDRILRDD